MSKNLTVYRSTALSEGEYSTLEMVAQRYLSFRERMIEKIVWKKDEYGDMVQRREHHLSGMEVFAKGPVNKALMESLCRPAVAQHVIEHLTKLAMHLPYARGPEGWGVVTEDIARDLDGISEYAIIKTCERFRNDPDLTFFPATALIVKYARDLDWSLRHIEPELPAKPAAKEPEPVSKSRTARQKRRVARIMRLAVKPQGLWTRWERRFFDAFNRHAKGS